MMNKVVVVGSYNVDLTITTDRLPQIGETVLGKSLKYGHGGKGANQAVAAARAGAQVQFLAKVGRDQYGEQGIASLAQEGIRSDLILQQSGVPTGMAFITVNKQGDNSIVVISGANWNLTAADVQANADIIADADILLTQFETPLSSVAAAIEIAHSNGVKVILNPAPAKFIDAQILKGVTLLTPNRVEAEMLSGIKITDQQSLGKAAAQLHASGVEIVLITLGAEGVFVSSPGHQKLLPSMKVEAVDTVGAGDVFSGVLAALYTGPETLDQTVSLAIAAAGISVMSIGAQSAIPRLEDVKSYIRETALVESI